MLAEGAELPALRCFPSGPPSHGDWVVTYIGNHQQALYHTVSRSFSNSFQSK